MFSDVLIPGRMNGFELAEKAALIYSDLKILLTSGFTDNTFSNESHPLYKENMMNKPYSQVDLAQRLRKELA